MDSLSQVNAIIEDFNIMCYKNKCWVDEILFGAREGAFIGYTRILPETPSLEKKPLLDGLKISDHGYESFHSSLQNFFSKEPDSKNSYNSNLASISEKSGQSVATQTDQVIILSLEDCEVMEKIIRRIRLGVECNIKMGHTSGSDPSGSAASTSFVSQSEVGESPVRQSIQSEECEKMLVKNSAFDMPGQRLREIVTSKIEKKLVERSNQTHCCAQTTFLHGEFGRVLTQNATPCICNPEGVREHIAPLDNRMDLETIKDGIIFDKSEKESGHKLVDVKGHTISKKKRKSSRVIIRKSLISGPNRNGRRSSGVHFGKKNNLIEPTRWKFFGMKKKQIEAKNAVKEIPGKERTLFKEKCAPTAAGDSIMSGTPNTKSRFNHLQRLFASKSKTDVSKTTPLSNHLVTQTSVSSISRVNAKSATKNTAYNIGSHAVVKCIAARRSSTFENPRQVSTQGSSVNVLYKPATKFCQTPSRSVNCLKGTKEVAKSSFIFSTPKLPSTEHNKQKTFPVRDLRYVGAASEANKTKSTFPKEVNSYESYDISDLKSDDESTPETPQTRKRIPSWATGQQLIGSLMKFYLNPVNVEDIFGKIHAPDLNEMFAEKKPRFDKRTSSANWDAPLTADTDYKRFSQR